MKTKSESEYSTLDLKNITRYDFLHFDDDNTLEKAEKSHVLPTASGIKYIHNNDISTELTYEYNWTNDSSLNETTESLISTSTDLNGIAASDIYTSLLDLFVFDDLDDYVNRLNFTALTNFSTDYNNGFNLTLLNDSCVAINQTDNVTECSSPDEESSVNSWWALILVIVPCLTLFGNVLVILAVIRERTLQTVTNYFIISLALADLLVAVLVMPFAVYVLVNGAWTLPGFVCDFYIAMDVTCSTSSIFNLVAISIDRYIAVTQPIKYAKHKNNRRVWMTILLVWAISAAIGSPIVLGLNNTPDRVADLCLFYNSDFIIYSSLSSFYIPCIIMVFLYWNIFKALRHRAARAKANRKPNARDIKSNSIIENIVHTQSAFSVARFAETALGTATLIGPVLEEPTNTASGSNEDEDETPIDPIVVISNDKSTEFFMATVVEEAAVVARAHLKSSNNMDNIGVTSNTHLHEIIDRNSSPSPIPRIISAPSSSTSSSPPPQLRVPSTIQLKKTDNDIINRQASKKLKDPISLLSLQLRRSPAVINTGSPCETEKNHDVKSKFTIYKSKKASKKKREKSSAKKERKATKTLAIVLGVFLICWVPFFTCNVMDALCSKLQMNCQPGVTAFIVTSWLGYMNSFVNPVIYTVFNPEFRKAFRKLIKV